MRNAVTISRFLAFLDKRKFALVGVTSKAGDSRKFVYVKTDGYGMSVTVPRRFAFPEIMKFALVEFTPKAGVSRQL